MNLPICVGIVVFFALPLLLWSIGVAAAKKRKGFEARAFAFVAGSDNRLSLSRLQAFLWTLVIFGSFAGAMASHTKINSGNQAEIENAKADVRTAADRARALKATADKAAADAKTAANDQIAGEKAAVEAENKAKTLAADPNAASDTKTNAQQRAAEARANAEAKADTKTAADQAAADAKVAADKAEAEAKVAGVKAKSYDWVEIPAALLALAGIAIGSGVFSGLISALNSEDKTACVTNLGSISTADLKAHFPDAGAPANPNCLVINGKNMGTAGMVRLDKGRAPILFWKDDGTVIIVDVPDNIEYGTLVVDTGNGKLCYEVQGKTPGLTLGLPKIYYEFSDFFRDDKNPSNFDLMKFQMFGWTVIAIVIYVYLFLADFRNDIESLPVVPQSIVILTGLSQGGYLTGKAVSNVGSNEKK